MTGVRELVREAIRPVRAVYHGQSVHRALQQGCRRIVLGSGGLSQADWIATDQDTLDLLQPDSWTRYFPAGSIDAFLAEHVWEHLTLEEGRIGAETCYRYLRPGGYLRVAVPDGFHPDPWYIEYVKPGGTAGGDDPHKVLYTYRTLAALFEGAGFTTRLLEYFDEAGQFCEASWSPDDGMIHRSRRFEERNADGVLRITSIILDALKPA